MRITSTRRAALAVALTLTAAPAALAEGPLQVRLGEPAPEFRLSDLEGNEVALQDFRGRYVVLHFGTSW